MKDSDYPTNNELNQPPEDSEWFTSFKGTDARLPFVFLLNVSLIFFSGHNDFVNCFFSLFFFFLKYNAKPLHHLTLCIQKKI